MNEGLRSGFRSDLRAMHEWPLVVFTALAIPAAGVFGARLIADWLHRLPQDADLAMPTATMALGAALLVSLAHLGGPLRAPLALRRAGRNMLATEVALATGLVLLGLASLLPWLSEAATLAILRVAGMVSFGLLAAFGLVYFLRGRRPWRGPLVAVPATSGIAAGMVLIAAFASDGGPSGPAMVLLVLDLAVFAAGWMLPRYPQAHFLPAHPAAFARRHLLIGTRLALVNIAPILLVATDLPRVAAAVLAAGLFVDRFTFYATTSVQSTEAEVARIESLIVG